MPAEYDVFISHAWKDGDPPRQIADALKAVGLRVWFDANEIQDFEGITRAVTEGLAKSKTLLAYYSKTYPQRRGCQCELTAAFLAAQTEGDPRRRVLVVNPESEADHIHPIELRDAKFHAAPIDDGTTLLALVQAIVKHVAGIETPFADIRPLTAPNWYGMRGVGSTRFVGRTAQMWKIHSLLHRSDASQITGASAAGGCIAQVHGLGGVGKSLLAEEYALRFGAAYRGGVFWLRAYGNDNAKEGIGSKELEAVRTSQMRDLAELIGLSPENFKPNEIEGAVAREIERRGQACLWVVDDIPDGLDGQELRRWFAPHTLARTLITTRWREYESLVKGIDLAVLGPDEAYELLTSQLKPIGENEEEQARELAKDLGFHALALDVTASALASFGVGEPFREFRDELARQNGDSLELAKALVDTLPNGHEASIAQTLLRSITSLSAEAQDFLRLASVLAVAPIPSSLLTAVFEKVDGLNQRDAVWRVRRAFHEVTAASLAAVAGESGAARTVHTLVSRAMHLHEAASPERINALRATAVEALRGQLAQVTPAPRLDSAIELYVAHARQVCAMLTTGPEANLVSWLARYDYVCGMYGSAGILYSRGLEFTRRALGTEHPATLALMGNLASTLRTQGDLSGAKKLQKETLAISRRVLGPGHPDTLALMSNLAVTLDEMGDATGARKLKENTLAICRRVLGAEHPDTLTLMNNLAKTLGAQGDLAGARRLQEETLAIRRRVLGPEHPDTLLSMNNLANDLRAQGDFAGARRLQEETADIRRRVLGPEHPDTLHSMNNLATILREQGELLGARKVQEQVLCTLRRVLGSEHPDTLISMGSLAATLWAQGDLVGARQLQEETLSIQQRVVGPEGPTTLTLMNNLAVILYQMGDLTGAHKLQEETLNIRRRLLGPEHPDTLVSMSSLATTLLSQGDLAGARRLQEEALAARRRVLGPEHPTTSIVAWNLFSTLLSLRDSEAALSVFRLDLLWLLQLDPERLGADQRRIREMVSRVKDSLSELE